MKLLLSNLAISIANTSSFPTAITLRASSVAHTK